VALLSGVGAPERLFRFARDQRFVVVRHAAFADHARWERGELGRTLEAAASAGAEMALITEKDEARWPARLESPIPVRVLRTELRPVGSAEPALALLREAIGAPGKLGSLRSKAEARDP
jgi:tetraacyldisaccharide-1-P 4'-kinase